MNESMSDLNRRLALLEREVAQLRRVQDCTATLISSLELEESLFTILETALDVAGAAQGSILLYNPERTHLYIANAIGINKETVESTRIPNGEGIAGMVAQTGEPILVENIDADPRFSERRIRRERSRSFASLPLIYRESTLGVMNMSHPKSEEKFHLEDLSLLTALANQAAVAIAHSELHRSLLEKKSLEQQLETARAIQEGFVPASFHLAGDGFEFAARNQAAAVVGGDLYHVAAISESRFAFFLGDVSGKGIASALYMARLFSDARHLIGVDPEPAPLLFALNELLLNRQHRGMFVTMCYGVADTLSKSIRFACAGHHPPIVRRCDGSIFQSVPGAMSAPMGIVPQTNIEADTISLGPGDILLLYSDGATESHDPSGTEFGIERLEESLAQTRGNATAAIGSLFQRLNDFTAGSPPLDDITLLAVRGI